MAKIGNKSTIPQGMLYPNGVVDTPVDPFVQATTRPAGTLLAPSPGYDSIRKGKNQFQGKGPTGGFRPMTYAEDIGGTGAALSVIPGNTSEIEATEWLGETPGQTAREGAFIIADRTLQPGYAKSIDDAYNTFPDMGDRTPGRPVSRAALGWVYHPAATFKSAYKQNPATAVLAGVALVGVAWTVGDWIEGSIRGRGLARTAERPAAESGKIDNTGIGAIEDAVKKAIGTVEDATNQAISAIGNATGTSGSDS